MTDLLLFAVHTYALRYSLYCNNWIINPCSDGICSRNHNERVSAVYDPFGGDMAYIIAKQWKNISSWLSSETNCHVLIRYTATEDETEWDSGLYLQVTLCRGVVTCLSAVSQSVS